MPRLTFEVIVPAKPEPHRVLIVGTDPMLGSWQPEKGLTLERQDDRRFTGGVDLPYGLVEFKVTRDSWATEETHKDGGIPLNYQYLVAHDLAVRIEVDHWKDCAPIPAGLIYGTTIELELYAEQLDQTRRVCVWLPPGYMQSQDSRHPVLYLLDGQDTLQALGARDHETIAADAWVRAMSSRGLIPELILVAVFHREDFGQRDVELSPQCDGPKLAAFLVHDLKPFIDFTFCRDRVLAEPANTAVLGFSLGASLALFMALRHPHAFGKFACLSTAFEDLSVDPPEACEIIERIRADQSFRPNRKIYFDYGSFGDDRIAEAYQQVLDAVLLEKGFVEDRDFKVIRAEGTDHALAAWRARLGAPLQFLFGRGA
ncbi:MAG: alpha/beta hydrolase-fold protein [Verrucomicrobiota bacterium]|nr:alpha/beta hydrolase-fold protein [Verrucomicrobiota bacterium]